MRLIHKTCAYEHVQAVYESVKRRCGLQNSMDYPGRSSDSTIVLAWDAFDDQAERMLTVQAMWRTVAIERGWDKP